MAAPTGSELQKAPSSCQELNKSADGSEAKGLRQEVRQDVGRHVDP